MSTTNSFKAFQPGDPTQMQVGKYTVNVYPVHSNMSDEEASWGYHFTKSALKNVSLSPQLYLDTLALCMNASAICDGMKARFKRFLTAGMYEGSNLTILGFHGSDGNLLLDATVGNDNRVLKPVLDGPIADCRPADVKYVRVRLDLDYTDIAPPAQGAAAPTIQEIFYLELPQTTVTVRANNNHPRELTTFHGVADLTTLSSEEMNWQVVNPSPRDGPIDIKESAFNVTNATVDEVELRERMESAGAKLSVPFIEQAIFKQVCPTYSHKPQALVDSIKQVTTDSNGAVVTLSVKKYHQDLLSAARPLLLEDTLPLDLCQHYLANFHPSIIAKLKESYTQFHEPHDRSTSVQMERIQEIYSKAQQAQSSIHDTQEIVRDIAAGAQSMSASATTASYPSKADISGAAFPSVAERTLANYDSKSTAGSTGTHATNGTNQPNEKGVVCDRKGDAVTCDGCGGNHYYMIKGVITCPRGHEAVIRNKADASKKLRHALYKESRSRRGGRGGGRSGGKKRSSDFAGLTSADQSSIAKMVKVAFDEQSAASGLTNPTYAASATGGGDSKLPQIFVTHAEVYFSPQGAKPRLPVTIDNNIPHMVLPIGNGDKECAGLLATVDTAAALSTGSYHYLSALAKRFPQAVAAIYTAEHHEEIRLTGIVQVDGNAVSTSLPIAFCFHTTLKTRDGAPVQVSIACGPSVSVNLILGIPFLKSAKGLIDLNDNVIEFKALDCSPLPLRHQVARLDVPKPVGNPAAVNHGKYAPFIAQLTKLDAVVAGVFATLKSSDGSSTVASKSKRARLDTSRWTPPESADDSSSSNVESSPISEGSAQFNTNPLGNCLASNNSLVNYRGPNFEDVPDSIVEIE